MTRKFFNYLGAVLSLLIGGNGIPQAPATSSRSDIVGEGVPL
jgi:hypothetical protein